MIYRIAVCDDDEEQLFYLSRLLREWGERRQRLLKIEAYRSAESFLFSYEENPCDLLLLDIEMGGQSGMELAKRLRAQKDRLPIIFVTGYSEYMSEGYDVEALHYLLKPLKKEKLFAVLERCTAAGRRREEILVSGEDGVTHVAAEEILYMEACGRKTLIRLADGSELSSSCGIQTWAERFDADAPEKERTPAGGGTESGAGADCREVFVQCHRSYLVSLRHAKEIRKTEILLEQGISVPVSRRMYEKVSRAFIRYYTGIA